MATKTESRRQVIRNVGRIEIDGKELETLINELIAFQRGHDEKGDLISHFQEGHSDDGEWQRGYLYFTFKRLENDFEYKQRMEMKEFSEKRQKQLYEELKKKFENKQ